MEQKTVRIGKTEYAIELPPEDKRENVAYILTGRGGKQYALLRNVHKPHLMFPLPMDDSRGLPKWWVTDKDGELRQAR